MEIDEVGDRAMDYAIDRVADRAACDETAARDGPEIVLARATQTIRPEATAKAMAVRPQRRSPLSWASMPKLMPLFQTITSRTWDVMSMG